MHDLDWLEILKSNHGFLNPEEWVQYARQHQFKKVQARKLTSCPDCTASKSKKIGQYVYYSNLINLKRCDSCGLIYADTELDRELIQRHFEIAYKDDEYFREWRREIFDQIADIVHRLSPQDGTAIDVGGAKGHLMAAVSNWRPDLRITVNDLSSSSCAWSRAKYGFETIVGSASDLSQMQRRFDVVTAIDVLYYEPQISKFLESLPKLVTDRGVLIIRVPNKSTLILFSEFLSRCFASNRTRELTARIRFFNPEHLYVFSRKYLMKRLKSLGFTFVEFVPAPLLTRTKWTRVVYGSYYKLAKMVGIISRSRIVITSSMVVVARKYDAKTRDSVFMAINL